MKKTVKFVIAAVLAASALGAWASDTGKILAARAKAGAPIKLGQWHAGFTEVKNYAVNNGLPLLAIWSNGEDCSHCKKLERCMAQGVFTTWMKESGVVFYFGCNEDKSSDDKYGGTAYNWCWKNQSLTFFPFVRFYWKAKKGTVLADGTVLTKDTLLVDTAITGDKFDNFKDKADGAKYAVSYAKKIFKQYAYDPNPAPAYTGGEFGFADAPNARLQVSAPGAARTLSVYLTRTNSAAAATAYTNKVVAVYPDSAAAQLLQLSVSNTSVTTNDVIWAAGQSKATLELDIPELNNGDIGKQITLFILGGTTNLETVATNHIDYVGEIENSPSNPTWVGKKTVDTLGWGEWTMDIDVATNKVAKQSGGGTLILVGGSQWCPDCAATDKWVLDTPEFKTWATEKKIACVAIDIPKLADGLSTPSLLTYDSYATSARFYTYNYSSETNDELKVMGGAGYLSRNGITEDEAAEIAARNAAFFNNAVPAGLCRPECMATSNKKTGKFKTGIPALILLRPAGDFATGIAGRIYQFNNVSPNSANTVYVDRIKELLETSTDADEESNDDVLTATATIGTRESRTGTLSFADGADYYKVDAAAVGSLVSYRLTGSANADVTLALINRTANGALDTLKEVTTNLADDVVFSYEIPKSKTNCYVKVSYPADKNGYPDAGSYFAFLKDGSTVAAYTLESDIVYVPDPTGKELAGTITDGNLTISMNITSGKTYYISNVDTNAVDFSEYFTIGRSVNTYSARQTTTAKIALTADTFTYRIWETGVISFDPVAASIKEKGDGVYEIQIARIGGAAGEAAAILWLDHSTTNFLDLIEFSDDGHPFHWDNNDASVRTSVVRIVDNPYSDGNQTIRFFLTQEDGTSDAGLGAKNFLLTIEDDDKANPGRLSLTSVDPPLAKAGAVYARAGATVTLAVERVGGTKGDIDGVLKATKGTLSESEVGFPSRVAEPQLVQLELPASGATSSKVTLTGLPGTKVDSATRTLTYTIVPANAPQFETDALEIAAVRYIPVPEAVVNVDAAYLDADGALSIAKVSGSLPSGVKATYSSDRDAITFSGVPTVAGTFTAVYRVSKGKTAGLALSVTVKVSDPAVKQPGATSPLNGSVLTTRTFSDIRVIGKTTKRLDGLMTLTIPRTGKISAKLRAINLGNVSFASKSWSSCGVDGALTATLAGVTAGAQHWTFDVTAKADGSVEITDFDDEYDCEIPFEAYSAANPADDFVGSYTVSLKNSGAFEGTALCAGDGSLAMSMTAKQAKTGVVKYAGTLPNGVKFSGSATLAPYEWDDELTTPVWANARLPLLSLSAADSVAGVMRLDRERAADYAKAGKGFRRVVYGDVDGKMQWRHAEKKATTANYAVSLDPAGGKYVATEDFSEIVRTLMEDPSAVMTFFAIPEGMGALYDGDVPAAWNPAGYDLTFSYNSKKKVNAITKQAKNAAAGFTVKFTASTGVFEGTFRLPTVNADNEGLAAMKFSAVMLPGFGSTSCTDCGGDDEATVRPMVCGAAWLDDDIDYVDALDRVKTTTTRRGCAVSVGKEAGK